MKEVKTVMICPSCNQAFDPAAKDVAKPFCSERCKWIDLGGWLDETYRIPGKPKLDHPSEDDF